MGLSSWWVGVMILTLQTFVTLEGIPAEVEDRLASTITSRDNSKTLLNKIQLHTESNNTHNTSQINLRHLLKIVRFTTWFPLEIDFDFLNLKFPEDATSISDVGETDDFHKQLLSLWINKTINQLNSSHSVDGIDRSKNGLHKIPLKFERANRSRLRRQAETAEQTGNEAGAPPALDAGGAKPKKKEDEGVQAKKHTWGHFRLITATIIIVWMCWFFIALGLYRQAASISKKAALAQEM